MNIRFAKFRQQLLRQLTLAWLAEKELEKTNLNQSCNGLRYRSSFTFFVSYLGKQEMTPGGLSWSASCLRTAHMKPLFQSLNTKLWLHLLKQPIVTHDRHIHYILLFLMSSVCLLQCYVYGYICWFSQIGCLPGYLEWATTHIALFSVCTTQWLF